MLNNILASRYKIIQFLGSGGFGQTYTAEDTHRPGNPICVVKHLKPISSQTFYLEASKRFFEKEAEALEKLGHYPQIPRLLAYFEEDNEFYLVQEFIQGNVLNPEFKPGRCWSENQVMQLLQEISEILHFVHSNGVIHRDLKPGNIIRRQEDNKLVLIDFGIIKEISMQLTAAQSQMATSVIIGTAGYMPPEQARGKPRFSSDIYALGVIAIQAITGLTPQELKEDAQGEIEWQSHTQINPLLGNILSSMVRYQFQDRYKSAKEVMNALEAIGDPTIASTEYPATQINTISRYSAGKSVVATNNTGSSGASLSNANAVSSQQINSAPQTGSNSNGSNSNSSSCISETSSKSPLKMFGFPMAIIAVGIIGIGAVFAAFGLNRGRDINPILANIEEIKTFKQQKEYSECIDKADKVSLPSQDSPSYERAKTELTNTVNECRILQAKSFAEQGDFAKAITEANKIPKQQPFSEDSQQLIDVWSQKITDKATQDYKNSGNLENAITTLKVIPSTSSHYQNAQKLEQQWQQQDNANKEHLNIAQRALTKNRYDDAIAAVNKIPNTTYWKTKKKEIIEKAESAKHSVNSASTSEPPIEKSKAKTVNENQNTTNPMENSKTIDNCQDSQSIFGQGSNCDN